MGISFNTKSKKKNTLWAPATSRLNWREYRSRLITAETPAFMRRLSRETGAPMPAPLFAYRLLSMAACCAECGCGD